MRPTLALLVLFATTHSLRAQDFALNQLDESPRHHEWIEVEAGERSVLTFVAYPEKATKTTAVIVLHENRGLTDWVRSFADQLAAAGYLALAPDLLSGFDPEHRRTSDFRSSDDARNAIYKLDPDQITSDLKAVRKYASELPASSGTTVVAGFCWGGSQSFRFATNSSNIKAAMVFYGSPPTVDDMKRIAVPVYGFYGENDERINATIDETKKAMTRHGKVYDYVIYAGAGHGFMRQGDDPNGSKANRTARDDAWIRIKKILSSIRTPVTRAIPRRSSTLSPACSTPST